MSRLTKKYRDNSGYKIVGDDRLDYYDVIDKLGKLEDLEQELGCPLEVVFKALIEKRIYFNWDGEITRDVVVSLGINHSANWYIDTYNDLYFYLKDYGKTWWLKEDRSE